MATTNKVKGWIGVLMTEDSSSHWPIKRTYVYSETSRQAGLEFVCIFGHDEVRSETQSSFGRVALKSRSTRSIGRAPLESGFVVLNRRPRTAPWRPISRIRRATVHRATSRPSRRSWRQTLRTPYTSKFSCRTRRISPRSWTSRFALAGWRLGSFSLAFCS